MIIKALAFAPMAIFVAFGLTCMLGFGHKVPGDLQLQVFVIFELLPTWLLSAFAGTLIVEFIEY